MGKGVFKYVAAEAAAMSTAVTAARRRRGGWMLQLSNSSSSSRSSSLSHLFTTLRNSNSKILKTQNVPDMLSVLAGKTFRWDKTF
jgi:hypothetical protein